MAVLIVERLHAVEHDRDDTGENHHDQALIKRASSRAIRAEDDVAQAQSQRVGRVRVGHGVYRNGSGCWIVARDAPQHHHGIASMPWHAFDRRLNNAVAEKLRAGVWPAGMPLRVTDSGFPIGSCPALVGRVACASSMDRENRCKTRSPAAVARAVDASAPRGARCRS